MKVSCSVVICFLVLGILNNFFLADSFAMRFYFNSYILMPSMSRMLRFRKTSSLFWRDMRNAQISHPHMSRLVGMASKMRYFLRLSTLTYVQNFWRDPIDSFPSSSRAAML